MLGGAGESANVASPCNWCLQSNMAKPPQVQSCAYVGTLLSRQRLQARLKQRFFQIPLNARFGFFFPSVTSGALLNSLFLPHPHLPPKCQRGVLTTRRGPKTRTVCPNLGSGGVFKCLYGMLGLNTLTEGSRDSFHTTGQKWGWEDEEATCRHTRAGCHPRGGGETSSPHPRFPPLVNLARDRISVSPKGAGLPRARAPGGPRRGSPLVVCRPHTYL